MARYRYFIGEKGEVVKELVPGKETRYQTLPPFKERMKRAFYDLECERGSRFNGLPEYSKNTLKRVWEA